MKKLQEPSEDSSNKELKLPQTSASTSTEEIANPTDDKSSGNKPLSDKQLLFLTMQLGS